MVKLDAKFTGTIVKAKDGSIVPADEYVVFLAKDNAFMEILPIYRLACQGMHCDEAQMKALDGMIARVRAWRAAHPDRLKKPDAAGEELLAVENWGNAEQR